MIDPELGKLRGKDPEAVPILIDMISQAVDDNERSLAEERARLAETVKGKAILVIDSSFGVPTANLQTRLRYLREIDAQEPAAHLVLKKVLKKEVPRNTTEVFGQFFGPGVNLVHQDIRYQRGYYRGEVGAVILTGSPANVDFVGTRDKLSKHTSLGDKEVCDRLENVHNFCLKEGIPVLAFCFGFQMISKLLGGEVKEMDEDRGGFETVTVTKNGGRVLKGLFGKELSGGEAYVSHGQQAFLNPEASLEILELVDSESGQKISHGSINADQKDASFNGNVLRNVQQVRQLMEDGRYVSLALQSHPELAFVNALLRNLISNVSLAEYGKIPQRMSFPKELLGLITDFLGAHKRIRR